MLNILFNLLGFWIHSYELDFSWNPTDAHVLFFSINLEVLPFHFSAQVSFCSRGRSEHALSNLSCSLAMGSVGVSSGKM